MWFESCKGEDCWLPTEEPFDLTGQPVRQMTPPQNLHMYIWIVKTTAVRPLGLISALALTVSVARFDSG